MVSPVMHHVAKVFLAATFLLSTVGGAEPLFQDEFRGRLGAGWSWVRENKPAWRVSERGLEVRIEPGNMWGARNDAKNVLTRPVPAPANGDLEISVTVSNSPTHQYEQVDLVWYYDDSNMVKLGLELVDRELCIVMGREVNDQTRTVAKLPVSATSVRLRFIVSGEMIRGEYLPGTASEWRNAGQCSLPRPQSSEPKISLHFYQGPPDAEHWALVTGFKIERR